MPSKSKKQHNFLNIIAHNPAFAAKAGVPMAVGKHFMAADKRINFAKARGHKKTYKGKIWS